MDFGFRVAPGAVMIPISLSPDPAIVNVLFNISFDVSNLTTTPTSMSVFVLVDNSTCVDPLNSAVPLVQSFAPDMGTTWPVRMSPGVDSDYVTSNLLVERGGEYLLCWSKDGSTWNTFSTVPIGGPKRYSLPSPSAAGASYTITFTGVNISASDSVKLVIDGSCAHGTAVASGSSVPSGVDTTFTFVPQQGSLKYRLCYTFNGVSVVDFGFLHINGPDPLAGQLSPSSSRSTSVFTVSGVGLNLQPGGDVLYFRQDNHCGAYPPSSSTAVVQRDGSNAECTDLGRSDGTNETSATCSADFAHGGVVHACYRPLGGGFISLGAYHDDGPYNASASP